MTKVLAGTALGLMSLSAIAADKIYVGDDAKKEALDIAIDKSFTPVDGNSVGMGSWTVNDATAFGMGGQYVVATNIKARVVIVTNGDDVAVGTKVMFSW